MAALDDGSIRKPAAFLMVNQNKVVDAGKAFCDLTGYPRETILQTTVESFFRETLRMTYQDSMPTNIPHSFETFLFTYSLEPREVIVFVEPTESEDSCCYLFYEKPNSRLDKKFPHVDVLFHHGYSGVAFFCISPEIILLDANQEYLDYLESPYNQKQGVIGRRIDEFVSGWRGSKYEKIWHEVITTGTPYITDESEYNWLNKGPGYFKSTIIPFKDSNSVQYIIEITTDITEGIIKRKHIEEQAKIIRKQKQQLDAIIQNMTDGLIVFDGEGNFILKNEAANKDTAIRICPKIQEAHKPNFYYDLDGKELSYEEHPAIRVFSGERVSEQIVALDYEEGVKYYQVSGTPIFDDDGRLQQGILQTHDITDYIKSEKALMDYQEKLLKAQMLEKDALREAMEMKDEFISFMTHEFKTPLAVINSALQAIEYLCAHELTERTKGFLDKIRQNTFRQLRLVNNLLDITRFNAGRIKINRRNLDIVFLTQEITESVRLYAQNKGVMLSFSSTMTRKVIGIDDEKYERILLNLLSNAIKFTPKGKSVMVNLSYQRSTGQVVIAVCDEGVGIPEEKQQIVFERFGQVDSNLTRQAEGTGIGLSLVKKFVQALNGNIKLQSQVSKGSTFTLYLPGDRVEESNKPNTVQLSYDSRLIQTTAIEFCDIYL